MRGTGSAGGAPDGPDRSHGPAGRAPGGAAGGASPWAPFRPRRGRAVALALIPLVLLGGVALALLAPGPFHLADRACFVLVAAAIAEFLRRQAAVVAVPTREGLLVRNLAAARQLAWAEVVEVRFGGGRPWAQLDLADGDVLAVMAVQRADGESAQVEAERLAALVVAGSRTPPGR